MRRLFAVVFFGFALAAAPGIAQARVFDLNKESFASYLIFSAGPSKIGDAVVADDSSATTFDATMKQNISGEFGFLYATRYLTWRFGFEVLKPAVLKGTASDASGTALYDYKSDVAGFVPKIGLEVNLKTTSAYRFGLFGAIGQGSITLSNTYTNLTIAPNADFTADSKGTATAKIGGAIFEFFAFDASTLVFEIGYRDLSFADLTYSKAVTGFGGTAHAAGDQNVGLSGQARELDFSGAYASFGARFYLF